MDRLELDQELAREILAQAKHKGASQGDVVMVENDSFFVTVRLGEIEKISQAREKRLGLRLFFGHSSATASTSDISKGSIERLVQEHMMASRRAAQDAMDRAFASATRAPTRARVRRQAVSSSASRKRRTRAEMSAMAERIYHAVCAKPGV